ncbi:hypothetical protein CYMTET_15766 [Cymbomonas tetramitiformis]|uniref:Cyclic nucleotide-binding domain-containing protein n=1 Tax=Cymbomonas tetramitiformis TaxID=36881 RepID=A0AAE0GDJ9_9CHLO|nr:hypothetical protein CYMTET_15766 [Cymbomonas tetramitiformis]
MELVSSTQISEFTPPGTTFASQAGPVHEDSNLVTRQILDSHRTHLPSAQDAPFENDAGRELLPSSMSTPDSSMKLQDLKMQHKRSQRVNLRQASIVKRQASLEFQQAGNNVRRRNRVRKLTNILLHSTRKPLKPCLLTDERRVQREQAKVKLKAYAGVEIRRVQFNIGEKETSFLELLLNHPMMDPHCLFVERWRTFMVVPMSYEMWAVPFRIAMTSELSLNYALIYTDVLTDALFLVDALIRLQTKIPSLEGQPENTRAEVFWHVMQQNVLKQLLPCVCMYAVLGHTEAFWLFFLAQAPRAWRSRMLMQYYRSMELRLDVDVMRLQLYKFVQMIFMVAHWVGCLYYFMASCMNFDNSTWYHQVSAQFSGFDTHSSLMAQYLIAMYKGFNGLTNLGYENVLPNNVYEMVMSVVVIYLQILIAAYILGTMFNYLVKRDPEAGSHKTMMEKMDEFLKRHHIPKDLVEDIHNYMWFQYRKASSNRLLSMESLPRTLMIELAQHRYRHVLDQNTSPGCALHGCNELFLQELVTHLKDMFLMPGERYIRAGDVPTEVAFLNSGLLQIKDEAGVILRTIRADVKNMSTTVGDTSVFVNIEQQLDVFADESSAVHLLTIQRCTPRSAERSAVHLLTIHWRTPRSAKCSAAHLLTIQRCTPRSDESSAAHLLTIQRRTPRSDESSAAHLLTIHWCTPRSDELCCAPPHHTTAHPSQ